LPPQQDEDVHALIIEQDAWVALMIENVLLDLGYTSFDVAVSAEEALTLARSRRPDLIASATQVGQACGIETVRTICSDGAIPSVFLAPYGGDLDESRADLAIVRRPFAEIDLRHAIGRATACLMPGVS